jgi:hypothetical protein
MRLLSHSSLGLNHFILLEVTEVLQRFGHFFVGELVLELISIKVKLSNHLINLFDMSFQALLRFLNTLIPQHRVESLNILLSYQNIAPHLKVSTSLLPR